jgi:hypothetical protein
MDNQLNAPLEFIDTQETPDPATQQTREDDANFHTQLQNLHEATEFISPTHKSLSK